MANISAIKLPDGVTYNIKDDSSGYITGYTETDPVFSASAAAGITSSDITNWNGKQAALISGTNIKTINNTSLLGGGDISVGGGTSDYTELTNKPQINTVTLTGDKSFADLGLIDFFYPVGSYYETSDTSFNPNTAWGGTWVLELAGMVHVSGGTGYPVSNADSASGVGVKDGGATTVTLDDTQIPAHTHGNKELKGWLQVRRVGSTANSGYISNGADGIMSGSSASGQSSMPNLAASSVSSTTLARYHVDASHTHDSVGGGQSHENMPPYINVNRWHRTA